MDCYLCNSSSHVVRYPCVRDTDNISVLECADCGLVFLNSREHITDSFYENSGMHGAEPVQMAQWLAKTELDDSRRFEMLRNDVTNRTVLDFGCGNGGFLQKLSSASCTRGFAGVELEARVREYWSGRLAIYPSVDGLGKFDLITAFHVFEHLADPRKTLIELREHVAPGGKIVLEVPNANDALLSLFNCDAFKKHTYWSQHLFLFTVDNLGLLARQAGFETPVIRQVQRYPLANHLFWLATGQSGGHCEWSFLTNESLDQNYSSALASVGCCDTLLAYLS